MPPKKDDKKKKKKDKPKKEAAVVEDEYTPLESDQLQEELKKMHSKLLELRRNRNYYMQERDMFQSYYDIVREDVVKTEAHIKNIEAQMERMQDTHKNDIRMYMQKVIHLEYEHANNVDQVATEAQVEREREEKQYLQRKAELKRAKLLLKAELRKEESAYEEEIKNMKEVESKEMLKLKEQFEEKFNELHSSYEKRLQALRDDLELRRKMEMHEIEERKNDHINDLMRNHEQAFNEMKNYYNSITRDNLELIKSLNDQIEELKVKHTAAQRAQDEMSRANEDLLKPLSDAEKKVKDLQSELSSYDKDQISLRLSKARLALLQDQLKSAEMEHSLLVDKYRSAEAERDYLLRTFEDTVSAVQKRAGSKNEVLERVLEEYKEMFQAKRAQFTAVLRAANLDPVVLQNVTKKLDDVLTSKNEQIRELQYDIAKITKAHNDLVRVMEAKLRALHVPESERGLHAPIMAPGGVPGAAISASTTAPADLIIS